MGASLSVQPSPLLQAAGTPGFSAKTLAEPYMTLSLMRGPLQARQNEVILGHYNRLGSAQIPMGEFLHWVRDGVEGPAWHAVLQNQSSEIVGHSAIIPFRGSCNGKRIVAGKAEYAFILEDYQTAKIRGFEQSGKPRNAVMIQQLFQGWQEQGLGPLFISTSIGQRSLSTIGCSVVKFPVCECLLVLRPLAAAGRTPNLETWQRAALVAAGTVQVGITMAGALAGKSKRMRRVPNGTAFLVEDSDQLSFFEDSESLKWRYLEEQYEQYAMDEDNEQYLIVKRGSGERYLRVCQWRLALKQPSFRVIARLVEMAQAERALGVRWAVYGNSEEARPLVGRLRKFGFLCVPRTRALLVYSRDPDYLSAQKWKLTDALFSFDP